MTSDADHQRRLERLRQAGLRPSYPRILILQVFEEAPGEPLSIEDVFRRIDQRGMHVSLGTVYRVAQQMKEQGLVQLLRVDGGKQMYRLRVEPVLRSERDTVQLWAVNRSSGERVPLRNDELRALVLAAVLDAGLSVEGGRLALELDRLDVRSLGADARSA